MQLFYTLDIIGCVVSIPCLILTYFKYYYSTEFQNLYKKQFMNYLVSLLYMNICFLATVLYYVYYERIFYYTSFLVVFGVMFKLLWTNVLCFNFWRNTKDLMSCDNQRTNKNTYIKCCIYVWLLSLLHTIYFVIKITGLIPKDYDWILNALNVIFNIFTGLVIICNFLMMIHVTIIMVREVRNLTGQNDIQIKEDKKKLILCFKLLTVIIIDLLFSAHIWEFLFRNDLISRTLIEWLGHVNSFRGLFIFIMFPLKKKKTAESIPM